MRIAYTVILMLLLASPAYALPPWMAVLASGNATAGTSPWGPELLTDGDFESLTGWTDTGAGQTSSLSTDSHEGINAGKFITDGIDVTVGFEQSISVTAGETYKIEGYGKTLNNTNSDGLYIRLMDGSTELVRANFSVAGNTDYIYQQIIYTIPASVTSVDIECGANTTPSLDGYCDNFSVKKRSAAILENLIANGGFETGDDDKWSALNDVVDSVRNSGLFSYFEDRNGPYSVTQNITLEDGADYKVSAYAKVENWISGNCAVIDVYKSDCADLNSGNVLAGVFGSNTSGWVYLEDTWTNTDNCGEVQFRMYRNDTPDCDTWFDDIKVEKL